MINIFFVIEIALQVHRHKHIIYRISIKLMIRTTLFLFFFFRNEHGQLTGMITIDDEYMYHRSIVA